MAALTVEPSLRRARASVFGIFGLNGFLLSMWVVHIPSITERTNVTNATLGMLILFLVGGGGILALQIVGPLADRFGSQPLVAASALLVSAAVVGPGLATNAVQLGIALAAFGFGNGALDVSMNTQAVHVERQYGRPIMSAFHALFSCGGIVGALVGAATLAAEWDIRLTLALASAIGVVVVTICTRYLLPHVRPEHAPPSSGSRLSGRVLGLGALAFAVLMSEGVANDWSALQLKQDLDTSDATAALAFGAFSLTMTVGRFTADRVAGALGAVAVVRFGGLIAACGIGLVVFSGWVPLALFGWALFGLGLSGVVPQIFTAAGNLDGGSAGTNMSRVFGLGYIGFLVGPALIGWLTKVMSLSTAMVVPLTAVLLAAGAAGLVRRPASA